MRLSTKMACHAVMPPQVSGTIRIIGIALAVVLVSFMSLHSPADDDDQGVADDVRLHGEFLARPRIPELDGLKQSSIGLLGCRRGGCAHAPASTDATTHCSFCSLTGEDN